jgi:hypothetical protein
MLRIILIMGYFSLIICLSRIAGIVSDLFPRMVMQEIDYGILEKSIRENCISMKLEDVDGKLSHYVVLHFKSS